MVLVLQCLVSVAIVGVVVMMFDNWKEEYGLQYEPNYSEHTEKDCKSAFEAGQQSQQAKIDELQKQVITQGQNFNDQAQKLKDTEYFNQKLQARVDEALRHVVDHGGYDDLTHVINILKGNKDGRV